MSRMVAMLWMRMPMRIRMHVLVCVYVRVTYRCIKCAEPEQFFTMEFVFYPNTCVCANNNNNIIWQLPHIQGTHIKENLKLQSSGNRPVQPHTTNCLPHTAHFSPTTTNFLVVRTFVFNSFLKARCFYIDGLSSLFYHTDSSRLNGIIHS